MTSTSQKRFSGTFVLVCGLVSLQKTNALDGMPDMSQMTEMLGKMQEEGKLGGILDMVKKQMPPGMEGMDELFKGDFIQNMKGMMDKMPNIDEMMKDKKMKKKMDKMKKKMMKNMGKPEAKPVEELETASTEAASVENVESKDAEPENATVDAAIDAEGEVADVRDGNVQLYAYPEDDIRFNVWKGPISEDTKLPTGEGTLVFRPRVAGAGLKKVRVYIGAVKEGLPHGKGQEFNLKELPDLELYQQLVNDAKIDEEDMLKTDFSKFEREELDTYEGGYVKGQKHGHGIDFDGDRCEGQFTHGEMNGEGQCTFKDGSFYQGQWENDIPNGEGIWNNGPEPTPDSKGRLWKSFEGIFQDGKKWKGIIFDMEGGEHKVENAELDGEDLYAEEREREEAEQREREEAEKKQEEL